MVKVQRVMRLWTCRLGLKTIILETLGRIDTVGSPPRNCGIMGGNGTVSTQLWPNGKVVC